jgi:metallo-beta-lactamase family protein
MPGMADVTFLGACGTVTGSCTLLSWGNEHILVDCGLFQGPDELELRNREPFPFRPPALTAVVLTHAHLDHCGRLPRLVREGFNGPIYCSKPTRGLMSLVLQDAAKLQEEEVRWARKKGYSRVGTPSPLFTLDDVQKTLSLVRRVAFDEAIELVPGITARYHRAGHLLGAASVEIAAKGSDGQRRTWCFSGDVGRYGVPILHDPQPPVDPPAALVLESTYGNRRHSEEDPRKALGRVIRETFARGGSVMIPSFALGRTQDLLYHLGELADAGVVPPDSVFVDSPMAISATELYRDFVDEHDEDLTALIARGKGPFDADRFTRCRTADQSRALNNRKEPAVIIAGSGMVNGGRILHHLRHKLPDPRHTLVFVGFQGEGTRGRALLEGVDTVAIHGQEVTVRSQVTAISSLSAHGDRDELVRWAKALPGRPERIFLNHGEDPARQALARALQTELGWPLPALPMHASRVAF